MNIKELIEEVERLKETKRKNRGGTLSNYCRIKLQGIKIAVEVMIPYTEINEEYELDKDWQKLKKILEVR